MMSDRRQVVEPSIVPGVPEHPAAGVRCGRKPRLNPPAGFPIRSAEVFAAVRGTLNERRSLRRARRALADYLGVRRVWLVSSGRAGLTLALRGLHATREDRDEVVVPAYTCYSVPSAIVRAGLRVRLVDVAPGSFEIDHQALARVVGDRTLAVVATHLLGFPVDLRPIFEIAETHGALVVDDAAQALGSRHRGRHCGAGGHVGILSFGRGKPLSTVGGGAITCDQPALIRSLEPIIAAIPHPVRFASLGAGVQACIYSWFLHPGAYWLPSRLPFLKIGRTEFDLGFTVSALAGLKLGLLIRGLKRLDLVNESRRRVAERLRRRLRAVSGVELVGEPDRSYPTYPRFPLLFVDGDDRDRTAARLRAVGVAAGPLYPNSLNRIAELATHSPEHGSDFPQAERLAASLLTLPTYPFVTEDLIECMCEVVTDSVRHTVEGTAGSTVAAVSNGMETAS